MAITWRKDVDKALNEARTQRRHLLLDFRDADGNSTSAQVLARVLR